MHAKNAAELHHTEAGLYRLMPGIVAGLFAGFFVDSPTAVLVVTIAANAVVYVLVLKSLIWLYLMATGRRSRSVEKSS
jgi:hypothetical protein